MLEKILMQHAAVILVAATMLAGCGGGEEDAPAVANQVAPPQATQPNQPNQPTQPTEPSAPANHRPSISGAPAPSVLVGQSYAFTPSASDADDDALSYSVQNLPSWATFVASTGRIYGTPTAAHLGTYSNIVISVSDGASTASLPAFSIAVNAVSLGSATLSWIAPTQNTDGSALTGLSGYRIMYGTSPSSLTQTISLTNPGLNTYMVTNLSPATWYFAVTAISSSGAESTPSALASKTIL